MSIFKNHFLTISMICILFVVLVVTLYFIFLFDKTSIRIDSVEKLANLLKADFSNAEITDIKVKYKKDKVLGATRTYVFVFLKESGELEEKEYYFPIDGGGFYDINLEQIPQGYIDDYKEIGLKLSQIQKHGGNYSQIEVGFHTVPYEIHWYQIDESYDSRSDVVLHANVPRKILINVDKIIQ